MKVCEVWTWKMTVANQISLSQERIQFQTTYTVVCSSDDLEDDIQTRKMTSNVSKHFKSAHNRGVVLLILEEKRIRFVSMLLRHHGNSMVRRDTTGKRDNSVI
jgi:hypothetical protein